MRPTDPAPVVEIARTAYDAMIAHCLGEQPHEAVGLLSGVANQVWWCHPLRNIAPAPHSLRAFLAAPYEQFLIERQVRAAGLTVAAIYHSHPYGGASLSADDIALAGRSLGRVQLVVAFSAAREEAVVVRAFHVAASARVKPIALHLCSESAHRSPPPARRS